MNLMKSAAMLSKIVFATSIRRHFCKRFSYFGTRLDTLYIQINNKEDQTTDGHKIKQRL